MINKRKKDRLNDGCTNEMPLSNLVYIIHKLEGGFFYVFTRPFALDEHYKNQLVAAVILCYNY